MAKRRKGGSSRRRTSSLRGFITPDLMQTVVGVTAGALLPGMIASRVAKKETLADNTKATGITLAIGLGVAYAAHKLGQKKLGQSIAVGVGAGALSAAVSKALNKAPGGISGVYEIPAGSAPYQFDRYSDAA